MHLQQLLTVVYNRVAQFLSTAPKGALSVTGILGLALLVYGYLQLRGNDNRADRDPHRERPRPAPGSAAAATQAATATQAPSSKAPPTCAPATPVGRAVAAQLNGAARVTVSIPGVVLVESTPAQLQESATIQESTLEVLKEMSRVSDVYLIAHVEDDVGEAVVTGALEAVGLLGGSPGQIKQHHVLCCSTLDGKVPIVRQLEPELHIDAHPASVDELKRFLPRLLLVREGLTGAGSSSANVGMASSLCEYFGL